MGHDPVPGPQGETGPQGPQGLPGRNPKIGIGYGPLPEGDDYLPGDIYIVKGNTYPGLFKGDLFKKNDLNLWVRELNLQGPQGLPGIPLEEVIANPEGSPVGELINIEINGVVYSVKTDLSDCVKLLSDVMQEIRSTDSSTSAVLGLISGRENSASIGFTGANGPEEWSGAIGLQYDDSKVVPYFNTNNTDYQIALLDDLPTKVSELDNDSGYLVDSDLDGYATQTWVNNNYVPLNRSSTITGNSDAPLTLKSNITEYSGISFKNSNNDDLGFFGAGYNPNNEKALFYDDGNSTREIAFKDREEIANIVLSNTWLNGLTSQNLYGKVIRDGSILYIVISGRLHNSTGSSISTSVPAAITGSISIPSEIGSKIYRKDGTTISQYPQNGDDITGASIKISNSTSGGIESKICNIYSSTQNVMSVWASSNTGSITVPAGGDMDYDMRIFLLL